MYFRNFPAASPSAILSGLAVRLRCPPHAVGLLYLEVVMLASTRDHRNDDGVALYLPHPTLSGTLQFHPQLALPRSKHHKFSSLTLYGSRIYPQLSVLSRFCGEIPPISMKTRNFRGEGEGVPSPPPSFLAPSVPDNGRAARRSAPPP